MKLAERRTFPNPVQRDASADGAAQPPPARFDAHRWYVRYAASHRGADPTDVLAGVPFN
jgi:hypothetical protein